MTPYFSFLKTHVSNRFDKPCASISQNPPKKGGFDEMMNNRKVRTILNWSFEE